MRTILLTVAFLFATSSLAADPVCTREESATEIKEQLEIATDVPSHLKGATIVVRLADGRETAVPAERFKVVPRKQQFLVTKTEKFVVNSCVNRQPHKNRIALMGGFGAQGGLADPVVNGNTVEVSSRTGFVAGAQYQRLLTERFSLGIQGQTNRTASLLLGVDF